MSLDLNSKNIEYKNNKVIIKALPEKGENLSVFVRPGDEVVFDIKGINPDKLEYLLVGGDIVVSFPSLGSLTFGMLGIMGFSNNPPIFNYGSGKIISVDNILSKIQEVNDLPLESINASFMIRVSNVDEETGLMNQEIPAPSTPQVIVIPQAQVDSEQEVKLEDFVAMYNDREQAQDESVNTQINKNTSTSSITSAGISDVTDAAQASLKFSIGFFQTDYEIERSSDPLTPTEVLGGGGSKLGNVSTAPSAQIEPHTIDLSDEYKEAVIYADSPDYFGSNGEFITRVVRIIPEQPEGFQVTSIDISGLPNSFEIIDASGSGAFQSLTRDVNGSGGFEVVTTESGTALEFFIKYPSNTPVDSFSLNVKITSEFSIDNLEPGRTIKTPDLTMLIEQNDINLQIKEITTASDYVYQSQAGEDGYILNSNLNRNIVYTSQGNSTVYGGVVTDTIYGQAGDDSLYGNAGNDTLSGGTGTNYIDGGVGTDTLNYDFVERLSVTDAVEVRDLLTTNEFGQLITILNEGVNIDLDTGSASGITADQDYFSAISTNAPSSGIADFNRLMPTFADTFINIENINATNYNDTIYGNAQNNALRGLSGDDYIYGAGGNDTLSGGDGNDYLEGGTDAKIGTNIGSLMDISNLSHPDISIVDLYTNFGDFIDGGAGEDTIGFEQITSSTSNGVKVFLNTEDNGQSNEAGIAYGADTSMGVDLIMNVENVIGSNYDDVLVGNSSNNTLRGLGGDDTIAGIGGTNYLYGFKEGFSVSQIIDMVGNEITSAYYIVNGSDTFVRVNNDRDVLKISSNQYTLYKDAITSADGTTFTYDLSAVDADNTINMRLTSIIEADKNDSFYSDGDDYLLGGNGDDYIYGNKGADTLNGSLGNNYLDGGSGIDRVQFSAVGLNRVVVDLETSSGKKYDSASVLLGTDTLANIEIVEGTSGNDTLLGDSNNNTLLGGAGDDTLAGRGGSNYLDGESGNNWVSFSDSQYSAVVDLGANPAYGEAVINGATSVLYNINNIIGSNIADTLSGNASSNTILGGRGDDTISGKEGSNVLDGEDGTNTLSYNYFDNGGGTNGLTISLSSSTVNHNSYTDSIANFQNLIGTNFNDILTGNAQNNTIWAGTGDDTLVASLGNDRLIGEGGSDTADYSGISSGVLINLLAGTAQGAGNDVLESIENAVGGSGNDTLIGSNASNTLSGGLGNDNLIGNLGSNTLDGGGGTDTADYSWTTTGINAQLADAPTNGTATGTNVNGSGFGISDALINIENIIGGTGNDTLSGNAGNNIIWGTAGANILSGGAGVNTLFGGTGDDIFIGGSGSDDMRGGGGNDTLTYENITTSVSVNLGENRATGADISTDTISNINRVIGGSNNDTLIGNNSNNSLIGGSGNDTLYGGRGNNFLDGGADRDIVDYREFSDRVVVNLSSSNYTDTTSGTTVASGTSQRFGVYEGVDTLTNIEDIYGSALDDTLIGNTQNNIIYGGAGRDTIESTGSSGAGVNSLYGGDDNDTIIAGAGNDYVDGGAGVDTLDFSDFAATSGISFSLQDAGSRSGSFNNSAQQVVGGGFGTFSVVNVEKIIATADNDTLEGKDNQSDTIMAGAGNDTLYATSGNDVYNGEAGLNTLSYSNYSGAISANLGTGEINGVATGYDQVSNFIHLIGSTGNDTILGSATANNTLDGGAGNDTIDGVAGNNTLIAGTGVDTLIARAGSDVYDGTGLGDDTVDYSNLTGPIDIILNSAGNATINGGSTYSHTLTQIEHIIGTTGNDTIVGDGVSINTINGFSGNDILQGGMSSADVLIGGEGDDTFIASSGGDNIDGSEGRNTLLYNTATVDAVVGSTGVYLDLSANRIYRDGFITDATQLNATVANIDTIYGSSHNDTIYGSSTDNLFYGGVGNDILWGREGSDTLYGGAGNDTLDGGEGVDILYAESGNNRLLGGSGNDSIYGGTGNDTLEGGEGADILDGSLGGNNTFIGGAGNDIFIGGAARDILEYSSSLSAISVDLTANTITSDSEGVDTLSTHFEMIKGSNLNDTIDLRGASTFSTIIANGGNDTIYASTNNDTIFGGNANDLIYANAGNNSYYGGNATFDGNGDIIGSSASGDDRVNYSLATSGINVDLSITANATTNNVTANGFGGADKLFDITRITGSNLGDIIKGSSAWNEISAGAGDDWIIATDGGDTIRGGTNTAWNGTLSTGDWLSFEDVGSGIDATMTAGAITGGLGTTTIFEIENLFGSDSNDVLRGDSTNNTLHGNSGNDAIYGVAGNNFLIGGAGDDTLYTGSGIDKYDGGDVSVGSYVSAGSNGVNTLSFYYSPIGVSVDLGYANGDGTFGRVLNDGYSNVETYIRNINNLTGTLDYSDTLIGNSSNNVIRGLGGADIIVGTGGENTLYGGTGNDTITTATIKNIGNRGDVVYGGEGTDTLIGSFNNDFLIGGTEAGADVEGDWVNYSAMALNGGYGVSVNLNTVVTFTDSVGDRGYLDGSYSQIFELDGSGALSANFDYVKQVEHIVGSSGADQLMGNHLENNTIMAGTGDDTLFLSSGQDYLDGEGGSDWLSLENMSGAISNFDLENNNAGDSKVYNIENVIDFNEVRGQTVWGTNSANTFIMYGGDDYALGRSGNDIYDMGDGGDRVSNNYGSDTIIGGAGTDILDMYNNLGSSVGSRIIFNNITAATYNGYATGGASLGLSNLSVVTTSLAISGLVTLADGDYTFYNITDGRGFTDYLYQDGVNPDFENFTLGNVADVFSGSDLSEVVSGNGGNDTIFGNGGNDVIYGGDGDDTIFGVSGVNVLEGGAGNDLIFGGSGNDTIRGISGYNTLYAKAGNNTVTGGSNNDTIFAGTGRDTIDGGNGVDTLKFDSGTQGVLVNLGSDAYGGIAAESFINSYQSGGSNQIGSVINIENVYGTTYADTIRGSDARNIIYSGSGDDRIVASLGNDEIHGEVGSDWLDFSLITTVSGVNVDLMTQNNAVFTSGVDGYNQTLFGIENIVGTAQNDTLKGGLEVNNTIYGGDGDDKIYGIGYANVLNGDGGNDTIYSGTGNDTIDGGTGVNTVDYSYSNNISVQVNISGSTQGTVLNNTAKTISMTDTLANIQNITTGSGDDTIWASSTDNTILSGAGADTIYAQAGTNTIYSANGDDVVYGGSGVDTINTQEGNDTVIASAGADIIDGGIGSDLVDYSSSSTGLNVTLLDNGATTNIAHNIGGAYTDSVTNVEGLKGSLSQANTLVGNNLDNVLTGGNLADTLKGVSGNNTLDGGAGDDTLFAGTGSDTLTGGTGTNTLNYTEIGALDVNVNLRTLGATYSNGSVDTLSGINNVVMGVGNDTVEGNQFANTLDGGAGVDTLSFSGATGSVIVNVTSDGAGTASGDGADTFSNFENYTLSANSDTFNVDDVYGSTINGGASVDTVSYGNSATVLNVTIDNDNTSATVRGGGHSDTLQSIEKIVGGNANDIFSVSNVTGITTLDGDGGENTLQIARDVNLSGVEILNFNTITIADGETLTLSATQLDDKTLTIEFGNNAILKVIATDIINDHDFDAITFTKNTGAKAELIVNNSVNLGTKDIDGTDTNLFDVYDIASGKTLTLGATQLDGKNVDIKGAGNLTINATATPADHDFAGVTKTTTGNINLNVVNSVDLSGQNLGGVNQYTVAASQALTLLNNQLTGAMIIAGAGAIILNTTATANTDLSSINNDSFTGTITLNDSTADNVIVMSDKDDVVNLTSGNDAVTLGAGTNTVNIAAANLTSADNISGVGTDTVNITTAGVSNTTGVSGIETINLANGTNTVTVGANSGTINGNAGADTFKFNIADLSGSDTVVGNGGTDTLEFIDAGTIVASQLTNIDVENIGLANGTNTITVGTKNFNITGNAGADTFNYAIADFSTSDTINGNGGTDNLAFTSSGTIASSAFANVTDVDNLNFFSGNDTLTFTDLASMTTLSGKFTSINGGSAGTDAITFSSAVSGTLDFSKYSEFETLTLSTNADNLTFTDAAAFSDFTDKFTTSINGGATGTDTLTFTNAVTTDLDMSKLSGFEVLTFGDNADTVTFGSDEFNAGIRTINLGGGVNSINADATYITSALTIAGGASSDTLNITTAGTAIDLTNVSGVENITLSAGNNTVTMGANNTSITGNSGSDIFKFTVANLTSADTVNGGSGTDEITFTDSSTSITSEQFTNVSNIDVVNFHIGNDTITIAGNDTKLDNVELKLGSGTNSVIYTYISDFTVADKITGGGTDTIGFSNSGSINSSAFANTSGIDSVVFSSGADTLTLSDNKLDSVVLNLGAGSDTVNIAKTNLSTTDNIDAGAGDSDILNITDTSGSLSFTDADFTNLSNFETLNLGDGSNDTITLGGTEVKGAGFSYVYARGGDDNITITDITGLSVADGGSGGNDTVTLAADNMNFASLSITNFETISVNGNSNLTGELDNQVSNISVANNKTLTVGAADFNGNTIAINTNANGNVIITADTTTPANNNFSGITKSGSGNVTLDVVNSVDLSGQNLGTISLITVTNGNTLTLADSQLASIASVSGAGNVIVKVSSNSSQDFANLSLSGTETIQFTGNSTFTGNFQNSVVSIDTGVTVTTDASIVTAKTVSGAGTLSVTNLDATLGANFTNVNPTTLNVDWSGTGIYTGNLTNVDTLTLSSGTMTSDASILNVATAITNNATLAITNLEAVPAINLTKITGGTINADWSGSATFTGNLSTANLTVSSGTMTIDNASTINSASSIVVNATMIADASKVTGDTISGSGTLTVNNLDAALAADFANLTVNTINADFSGTGIYTGNLTNVDTLTVSSGTMTVTDDILGTLATSGAGSIVVQVNSSSSQDFANLSLSGTETIQFTGNSTFTGNFQNSVVSIDTGVTVTTDASIVTAKTVSGAGTLSVTNLDATLGANFTNVNPTTLNVDWSGTGIYTGNLTNVDTLTLSSGTMTSDASILNVATAITNNATLAITNLEAVPAINLTKITGGTINADWSGTATFTGNLSTANLTVSSGTMTVSTGTIAGSGTVSVSSGATLSADATKLSGDTISGAGTVSITNLQSGLTSDFTNIATTTVNANWASGTGIYTGNLTNVDTLTISSGTMTVADSILGTTIVNGGGNLTVNADDASVDLSNVNSSLGTVTVNDSSSDINIIGSVGDDILHLSSGNDAVNLGAGNDTINVATMSNLTSADNITDTSGTDTFNINGNGTIASTDFNITGFENLNFANSADVVTFTDKGSFDTWSAKFATIDFGSSNDDSISFSDAVFGDLDFSNISDLDTINLSSSADNLTIIGDKPTTINALGGDDTVTLDFTNIANFTVDGGAGSDTLSVSGSGTKTLIGSFSAFEVLNLSGFADVTISETTINNWSSAGSLELSVNNSDYYYRSDADSTWLQKSTNGALNIDTAANSYWIDLDSNHDITDLQLHVV